MSVRSECGSKAPILQSELSKINFFARFFPKYLHISKILLIFAPIFENNPLEPFGGGTQTD
jgi:hypothetical protein